MATLRIIKLINGEPTEYDGKYLVDYDPTPQEDEAGEFVHLVVTDRRQDARQFDHIHEAMDVYLGASTKGPRLDGQPDRPLSAYSVEVS
jgi:hypothetical protein